MEQIAIPTTARTIFIYDRTTAVHNIREYTINAVKERFLECMCESVPDDEEDARIYTRQMIKEATSYGDKIARRVLWALDKAEYILEHYIPSNNHTLETLERIFQSYLDTYRNRAFQIPEFLRRDATLRHIMTHPVYTFRDGAWRW